MSPSNLSFWPLFGELGELGELAAYGGLIHPVLATEISRSMWSGFDTELVVSQGPVSLPRWAYASEYL